MATVKYEDFHIIFTESTGDSYRLKAQSVTGSATGDFQLPFAWEELPRKVSSEKEARAGSEDSLGSSLFNALFSGEVGALYHKTVGHIESQDDLGMRLLLQSDLRDDAFRKLATLPWELMRDASRRQDLSLSSRSQITRFIEVQRPRKMPQLVVPLKILVAYSNPRGTIEIDSDVVARERELLTSTLSKSGDVKVDVLDNASLASIRGALDGAPYDVLHYLGHGSFRKGAGKGFLNLEKGGGDHGLDQVDAVTLGNLLESYTSVKLVVLNACKSAEVAAREDQDAFMGIAPSLVMAGVPAVIAMQYIISAEAAATFSEGFYEHLVRSGSLEGATARGRMRIAESFRDDIEWATPVLFSTLPDSQLLAMERSSAQSSSPEPPASEKKDDAGAEKKDNGGLQQNVQGNKNIIIGQGDLNAGNISFD